MGEKTGAFHLEAEPFAQGGTAQAIDRARIGILAIQDEGIGKQACLMARGSMSVWSGTSRPRRIRLQ